MNTFEELALSLGKPPVHSFDLLVQVSVAPLDNNQPLGPSGIFINGVGVAHLDPNSDVNPAHLAFLDEFVDPIFPRELGEVLDFWMDLAMQDACLSYSLDQSSHCGYHVMLGYSSSDGVVSAIAYSNDRTAPVRYVDFTTLGSLSNDLQALQNIYAVGSHVDGLLAGPRLSRDLLFDLG